MFVADQPAAVAAAQQPGLIEVVGTRRDRAQKIDRRIYRVRQGPHSAQADLNQLLRGIPAVTVTPDQGIQLLGSSNVSILIDEQPPGGGGTAQLRGSDIERIEIITNPSAQFSPQGSGGIINIVLRRKQGEGTSGSAAAELTSLGRGSGNGSWKHKRGAWTYELSASGGSGTRSESTYRKVRTIRPIGGAPVTNGEEGGGSNAARDASLGGKVTYELDSKSWISASAFAGLSRDRSSNDASFYPITGDFDAFAERQRFRTATEYRGAELHFARSGPRDGERLGLDARLFGNPRNDTRLAAAAAGSDYAINQGHRNLFAEAKADWTRPLGGGRILTLGGTWNLRRESRDYAFGGGAQPDLPGATYEFDFHDRLIAAFATFQQPLGKWTAMPGLRVERFDRTIESPGQPRLNVARTSLFPTFHFEHPLNERVSLRASYSRRIDRPDPSALLPYPVYLGGLVVRQGNPELRDQTRDAFELSLTYQHRRLDAGLILYARDTDDLWATRYVVDPGGLSVETQVNSGRQSDRGAQFDISLPLLPHLKGTASFNLFDSRVPLDPLLGGGRSRTTRATGNASLEWRGPDRASVPGSTALAQLTYASAYRFYQIEYEPYVSLSLSWTHNFTRQWSMTALLKEIGATTRRHRLDAPLVEEDYFRRGKLPEFSLKLVRTFGNPN